MYTKEEREVLDQALAIVESKLRRHSHTFTSSSSAGHYGQIQFGNLDYEVFSVLHMDNQHRLIEAEALFRGTIDGAAVYPREVVKSVLAKSAAAVIFMHNHPSGELEFSQADRAITNRLRDALEVIEVRVLDHVLVSATGYRSMSEAGLL